MKLKYIMIILGILLLVGCSNSDSEENKQADKTDAEQSEPTKLDQNASIDFKEVIITIVDQKNVTIEGKIKAKNASAFYRVEHDSVLVDETELDFKQMDEGWSDFDIKLTLSDKVVESGKLPALKLYGKDKYGNELYPNYLPIDYIRQSY
ncbi:MAG TPA: hypothetical protein VK105_20560 [Virgibacillus sp.]|nr:hypothetical protein [Virgibacillus sp.]HLR69487.1 hypothetical protein [Virgibacillus sp.]